MILYPAVDLRGGVCVRLMHGRFDQITRYDDNPAARLGTFARAGASWAHVVDLDGAEAGRPVQHTLIGALARDADLHIQCGGGVRTEADVRALLRAGVERVVIGSLAVTAPDIVRAWLKLFGADRLTLAVDVRLVDGRYVPALNGWTQVADVDFWAALDRYPPSVARHLLITDVGRDGALTGPNIELLAETACRRPDLQVQASGGVSALADLAAVRAAGCAGIVIGRALYEARFTIEQALAA